MSSLKSKNIGSLVWFLLVFGSNFWLTLSLRTCNCPVAWRALHWNYPAHLVSKLWTHACAKCTFPLYYQNRFAKIAAATPTFYRHTAATDCRLSSIAFSHAWNPVDRKAAIKLGKWAVISSTYNTFVASDRFHSISIQLGIKIIALFHSVQIELHQNPNAFRYHHGVGHNGLELIQVLDASFSPANPLLITFEYERFNIQFGQSSWLLLQFQPKLVFRQQIGLVFAIHFHHFTPM